MEKQLPAARKLELIPIERRNFPEADRKQKKIQRKRKERDNAARGLIAVTVASMMLNAVMAVIIYILQAVTKSSRYLYQRQGGYFLFFILRMETIKP